MPLWGFKSSPQSKGFPIWRRPFQSLPTRIGFFVLGATLCTSLVVTGISLKSIDSFLRERVTRKFPTLLENANERLDLWYAQRRLELDEISKQRALSTILADLRFAGPAGPDAAMRQEASALLAARLKEMPSYVSLFVLDERGRRIASAGSECELTMGLLEQLRGPLESSISRVAFVAGERIQIATVRMEPAGGARGSRLHGGLRLTDLDAIIASPSLGASGHVYVAGPDGRIVISAGGKRLGTFHRAPIPAPGAPAELVVDSNHSGESRVSIARRFGRFGWTVVVEEEYGEAFAPVASAIRRVLGINLAIIALFGVVAYRVAVVMVRPIDALSSAARRISQGEKDVRIPHRDSLDEVGLLTRAFSEMTGRLATHSRELEVTHRKVEEANSRLRSQNDELQRMNEVLAQLSITDGLTQLHNHRYFQEFLTNEVKRTDRTGEPLSLILVDIDHFKRWNDRLGHAAGDEILRRIAEVMNTLIRGTDLLARYGGEEFALVAPGTTLEGAVQLAEKMRATIAQTRFFLDPPSEHDNVTVSMGVALYHGDRMKLFKDADQALYRAKAAGRDCVIVAGEGEGGEESVGDD